MELLALGWDIVVHLDRYLGEWLALYGVWFYAILFLIIFCETGLVVWPFLPGDSLLFVVGALAASAGLDVAWQSQMLLIGFSQGAFSTAVVQRALEAAPRAGVEVRAAAALASPLDLAAVFAYAVEGAAEPHSLYTAFIGHAYCRIYNQPSRAQRHPGVDERR